MRIKLFFLVSFLFCFNLFAQQESAGFSKPEEAVQKFLELYFKGDWFGACKLCACEGCEDQMSFMIKRMDEEGTITDESQCKFVIEKVEFSKDSTSGKVYYTKICPGIQKPKKNNITVKRKGAMWLVEYIYRRDKFL
jgi:hypothetical protein